MSDTAVKSTVKAVHELSAPRQWLTSALLMLFTAIIGTACVVVLSATLTQTRVSMIEGTSGEMWKLIHAGRQWAEARQLIATRTKDIERKNAILDEWKERVRSFESGKPESEARAAKTGLEAVEAELKELHEKSSQSRNQLDQIFDLIKPGLGKDHSARARIEYAFYELYLGDFACMFGTRECRTFRRLSHRILYNLHTRPDLATFLLVILMGVLGSSLQMSHTYFIGNRAQTIGGYFQRLTVGAMTALVIFIVAKAGVPILTDPSRLGGDAPINPYFVSFLAIISGLMSENAIANIQEQGSRLFGGGSDGPIRWVRRDLTGELPAKRVTMGELADLLDISEETATKMLSGTESVEPAQQKLISALLREDPRQIYTDMPPPK